VLRWQAGSARGEISCAALRGLQRCDSLHGFRNFFLIILLSFLIIEALFAVIALASLVVGRTAIKRNPISEKWHRFRESIPR